MTIGARFLRADLHIHSFGEFGSYDVVDHTMTPEAIVDTAIEKGLSIISITDHNEIQNVDAALRYSMAKIFLSFLVLKLVQLKDTFYYILRRLKT